MQLFNSDYFKYQKRELFCDSVAVKDILASVGTPTYIYSKKFFIDRFNEFENAFESIPHKIFFAVKANFNLSTVKTFIDLGCGVDVNSEGELYRATKAGAKNYKMILTGVGKTEKEIRLGLEKDLLMIKAESFEEILLINKIANEMNKLAPLAIRVNPDVDAKTHPYISTGLSENKFGISSQEAVWIFEEASKMKNVILVGIDMHIGSQITSLMPFVEAVEKLADVYFKIKDKGIRLKHFDVGGGMGISYNQEKTFGISELANSILPTLRKLDCEIFFEPGRYLTANGGIIAAKVLYTKKNNEKNFVVVDAAMTDLLRPSIYGAYHHVQPINLNDDRQEILADIVGPVCESGDFIAKNRELTEFKSGEYLAVMSSGAYGMVMASNYNARRRAAEVMVDDNEFYLIRSRETLDHLLWDEEALMRKDQ
jgi:diaminopimelate decarboxylase